MKARPPISEETRAKMSAAQKGKRLSAEHRAKIGAANRGNVMLGILPEGQAAHNWKGDQAGYLAIHQRARKTLPKQCAWCGTTEGRLECALRHDTAPINNLRTHESPGRPPRVFSISMDDYVRLCVRCHARFDRVLTHCKRGHAYDDVNTYHDPHGKRRCRECRRELRRQAASR